jgi:HD-GYP domain-containing protein (c-di-GMP phosphodiesterase class II)
MQHNLDCRKGIKNEFVLPSELQERFGALQDDWLDTFGLNDNETREHCQRVMNLTLRLAQQMGVDDEEA